MTKAYVAAQVRLTQLKSRLAGLRKDESGAALVEYAMVVGLMAVIAVGVLSTFDDKVTVAFNNIGTQLAGNTTLK
ncbi:Flp family type IVb pilin [Phenylobacterium deserti]|uniref:Flp family type IVb pilin n=1 Tax=Phenylobacterium deserti TaxID=1914756 RepID=A0A328AI71_9CAUL|nr:Flp family type IVb pilin [Phenylobacterium deserti]RAK52538.1 Flp family type IVb pilin [Phenylobacterium deserti]